MKPSDAWLAEARRIKGGRVDALVRLQLDQTPAAERQRARYHESSREAAALDAEIAAQGVPLSIYELTSAELPYPELIPILLRHVGVHYSFPLKFQIMQSLVHFGGKPVVGGLSIYLRENCNQIRDDYGEQADGVMYKIGDAIAEQSTRSDASILERIVRTPEYGRARDLPALALARRKQGGGALVRFFEEGSRPSTAIRALRLARIWSEAQRVAPYVASADAEVRKEARLYLKRYEAKQKRDQAT